MASESDQLEKDLTALRKGVYQGMRLEQLRAIAERHLDFVKDLKKEQFQIWDSNLDQPWVQQLVLRHHQLREEDRFPTRIIQCFDGHNRRDMPVIGAKKGRTVDGKNVQNVIDTIIAKEKVRKAQEVFAAQNAKGRT